jgi:hypothetical protein
VDELNEFRQCCQPEGSGVSDPLTPSVANLEGIL